MRSHLPYILLSIIIAACAEAAPANETPTPKGKQLSHFKIIAERNIFNPKRSARSTTNNPRRETPRSNRPDNLVLTGTMTYDKGTFAFFDGSSSAYKKVVEKWDKVGGLEVRAIHAQFVVLAEETNEFKLPVGHQLQKREDGPWRHAGTAEFAYTSMVSSAPAVRPQLPTPEPQQESGTSDFINRILESALGGGALMPPPPGAPPPQTPAAANSTQQTAPAQPDQPAASQEEILRRLMQRREQEMN